jgi:hypothetical protein
MVQVKHFLLFALFSGASNVFSQDNLVESTCNCITKVVETPKNKIDFCLSYADCFNEASARISAIASADSVEAFVFSFYDDLSRNCDSDGKFRGILNRMTLEPTETVVKDRKTCKQIMRTGEFEQRVGTEKVMISMRDSTQIVTFDRGQFTKSKVMWIDACSYRLIFVASTNPVESAFLKDGDERIVRIIDIRDNGDIVIETGFYDRWYVSKITKVK